MEKFTPLAKFYTAAGTDGMEKFHLCFQQYLYSAQIQNNIHALMHGLKLISMNSMKGS